MTDEQTRQLEQSDILGLIVRYCAPTILAALVNAAYNVVDRIFVGKFVGEDALAALTVCFTPAMLFLAFGMLIGQGSGTLISIRLGEKRRADAERILGQAFFLFLALALCVSTLGVIFAPQILHAFGADQKILPISVDYYRIILAGYVFEKISFGVNGMIRAEGRPNFALMTILIGGCVNVALDYLFIVEFGWGVKGAAYATIIGQATATAWVMYFYLRRRGILQLRLRNVRPEKALALKIAKLGSPIFIVQLLSSASMALQVRQAGAYGGSGAVTTIGICMTATMFFFLPLIGISMGIQPIVGYNWGARNCGRALQTLWRAVLFGALIGLAGWLAIQIFAPQVAGIFLPEGTALGDAAARALRICMLLAPCIGVNIIAAGYFQATGRPGYAIWMTTLRQLIILVPMLLLLPLFFGLDGIWLSFPVADLAAFAYSLFVIMTESGRVRRLVPGA